MHTVEIPILVASVFKHVAKRLGVARGLVDDFTVEHTLVVAVYRDVVVKLRIGIDASDGLGALPIASSSVRKGNIPGAVVGTGDDGRTGSGGDGGDGGSCEVHLG